MFIVHIIAQGGACIYKLIFKNRKLKNAYGKHRPEHTWRTSERLLITVVINIVRKQQYRINIANNAVQTPCAYAIATRSMSKDIDGGLSADDRCGSGGQHETRIGKRPCTACYNSFRRTSNPLAGMT
jgi:hypothetical protein